jgi:hypothetical protein
MSREGTVIYLTDTPADALPFDAKLLAVGEAIDNVGFTGVSFTTEERTLIWRAMVRNYGDSAVEREWSIQTSTGSTTPRSFQLAPGALITLQSAFPKDAQNVRIVLSGDRFPTDDVLPIVAPMPKSLAIFTATSPAFAGLTEKLLRSLDAAVPTSNFASADLLISSYDPLDPVLPPGNSVIFVEDSTRAGAYLKGGIVAEPHPWLDGLNWQALLARETIELDRLPSDSVLLWQDKRPLIFLRESGANRQLCFNFDLRLSNAVNQPAFIVLLHRFAESIRERKVAPTSANLETGQPIQITTAPEIPLEIAAIDLAGKPVPLSTVTQNAPRVPGFLTAKQNDTTLLNAAVFFADTREADFRNCGKSETVSAPNPATIERHTQQDPWWRVWILLLIAALLVSWKFSTRSKVPT